MLNNTLISILQLVFFRLIIVLFRHISLLREPRERGEL